MAVGQEVKDLMVHDEGLELISGLAGIFEGLLLIDFLNRFTIGLS